MDKKKSKLSKDAGLSAVTEMLYSLKSRKDILEILKENYNVSDSTVDNWIRQSKPIVAQRIKDDSVIRDQVNAEQIAESATRLNITRERILERLSHIAFGDSRAIFTVDGALKSPHDWDISEAGMISGVDSFDVKVPFTGEVIGQTKKIKFLSPLGAVEILNKMLGYNLPEKTEVKNSISAEGQTLDVTKLDDTTLAAILAARKNPQ